MTIRNNCDSSSGQPLVRNDVICRQLGMLILIPVLEMMRNAIL